MLEQSSSFFKTVIEAVLVVTMGLLLTFGTQSATKRFSNRHLFRLLDTQAATQFMVRFALKYQPRYEGMKI
jgi:hypothetical protein